MNREFFKMQKLAGLITENQWRQLIKENNQQELDKILDKLLANGVESLTSSEKNFLDMFSKGKLDIGHVMSNDEFLQFLNSNKDEIFDEIYSQYGYNSEDVANLKKYYEFAPSTDGEEFVWYDIIPTVEINYGDPRFLRPDIITGHEQVNIAQNEHDFLQDFIQASLEGLEDEYGLPEILSKNIKGKNIYYSVFSW